MRSSSFYVGPGVEKAHLEKVNEDLELDMKASIVDKDALP